MATTPFAILGGTPVVDGAAMMRTAFAALRAWRARRRVRFELGRLDDRLLRDIGLTRADLDDI